MLQLQFSTTTESILVDCVTVWYTGCSAADTKDYPQGNKHSTKTTGTGDTPPKSFKNTKDSSHSRHLLCDLLPCGRYYRSVKTRTVFYPSTVTVKNHFYHSAPLYFLFDI